MGGSSLFLQRHTLNRGGHCHPHRPACTCYATTRTVSYADSSRPSKASDDRTSRAELQHAQQSHQDELLVQSRSQLNAVRSVAAVNGSGHLPAATLPPGVSPAHSDLLEQPDLTPPAPTAVLLPPSVSDAVAEQSTACFTSNGHSLQHSVGHAQVLTHHAAAYQQQPNGFHHLLGSQSERNCSPSSSGNGSSVGNGGGSASQHDQLHHLGRGYATAGEDYLWSGTVVQVDSHLQQQHADTQGAAGRGQEQQQWEQVPGREQEQANGSAMLPDYLDAASRSSGVASTSEHGAGAACWFQHRYHGQRSRWQVGGVFGPDPRSPSGTQPSGAAAGSRRAPLELVEREAGSRPPDGEGQDSTMEHASASGGVEDSSSSSSSSSSGSSGSLGDRGLPGILEEREVEAVARTTQERQAAAVARRRRPPGWRVPRPPSREEHRRLQMRAEAGRRALLPRQPSKEDLSLTVLVMCATHWRDILGLLTAHREQHEQRRALQLQQQQQLEQRQRQQVLQQQLTRAGEGEGDQAVPPEQQQPAQGHGQAQGQRVGFWGGPPPQGPPAVSELPFTPQHVAAMLLRTSQVAHTAAGGGAGEVRRMHGMVEGLARIAAALLPSPGMGMREITTIYAALLRLQHPVGKPYMVALMTASRKILRQALRQYRRRAVGSGSGNSSSSSSSRSSSSGHSGAAASVGKGEVSSHGLDTGKAAATAQHTGTSSQLAGGVSCSSNKSSGGSGSTDRSSSGSNGSLCSRVERMQRLWSEEAGEQQQQQDQEAAHGQAARHAEGREHQLPAASSAPSASSLPYNGRDMAQLIWCVASSRMERLRADWAEDYFAALLPVVPQLTAHGVSTVLYSLARLRSVPPPELLSALCDRLAHLLTADPAAVGLGSAGQERLDGGCGPAGGLEAQEQEPCCRPVDVSQAVWALATLRVPPCASCRRLLAAAEAHSVWRLQRYPQQELCNLLWGMAKLQHVPGEAWLGQLYGVVLELLEDMRPQGLAMVLYSLALMQQRPPERWLATVLAAAEGRLAAFPPQALALTVHALAAMGHRPQESWLRSFHSVLESHRGRVDPRVRDKVREAYRVLGFKAGPAAAAGTGSASAQRSPQQVQVPAQQQQEQRRTQPATGGMAGGLRNGAGRKAGAEQRWQQQQQEQREPRARQRDEALSDDPDEWGPPQDAGAGGAAAGGYEGADAVPVLVRPSRFAV